MPVVAVAGHVVVDLPADVPEEGEVVVVLVRVDHRRVAADDALRVPRAVQRCLHAADTRLGRLGPRLDEQVECGDGEGQANAVHGVGVGLADVDLAAEEVD